MTAAETAAASPLHRLLRRAVDVKPEEVNALLMSFVFFFFVLSGYFVLRPIRDAVAAASGILLWVGVIICGQMLPFLGRSF